LAKETGTAALLNGNEVAYRESVFLETLDSDSERLQMFEWPETAVTLVIARLEFWKHATEIRCKLLALTLSSKGIESDARQDSRKS
jgi:hypothetical protein